MEITERYNLHGDIKIVPDLEIHSEFLNFLFSYNINLLHYVIQQ